MKVCGQTSWVLNPGPLTYESDALRTVLCDPAFNARRELKKRQRKKATQQNKVACALPEDTDQPGHLPSLFRVFTVCLKSAKGLSYLHANSKDSDQTGQMSRLICVFAGGSCNIVGFVILQLIYFALLHVSKGVY